jgi:hypothetical protein
VTVPLTPKTVVHYHPIAQETAMQVLDLEDYHHHLKRYARGLIDEGYIEPERLINLLITALGEQKTRLVLEMANFSPRHFEK